MTMETRVVWAVSGVLCEEVPFSARIDVVGPGPMEADFHGCFEVSIVLSGRYERHYAGLTLNCEAGDIGLIAAWEPHGWRMLAPETVSVVLQFLPEALGDGLVHGRHWLNLFGLAPADRPRVSPGEMQASVLEIAGDMAREIRSMDADWLEEVRLQMLRVFLVLTRHWDWPVAHSTFPLVRTHDLARVMPAITLAGSRLDGRVDISEAAGVCGLSVRQFSRVFRRVIGVSFGRFALRARLAEAARRMLCTDLSVEAIASETGFVDGGHLQRIFRAHYRMTPARYREGRGLPRR